jgi:cytochrome b561
MFAQPVLGVLSMQAGDKTVVFLGWALPKLMDSDPAVYFVLKDVHKWIGNSFYFLIGMHALGALWHHFVLKDDSLRGMLTRPPKD